MKSLKIGILDWEEAYVRKLSAYLNRYGQGMWSVAAFTDKETLCSYLKKRELHMIAATNRQEIRELQKDSQGMVFVLLTEEKETGKEHPGTYFIYRYQSAKVIGKIIKNITEEMVLQKKSRKPMVAVYSPVGRCGKTAFALEVVKSHDYGEWLYVGMEDYGCIEVEGEQREAMETAEDHFLYYVKERQEEKVIQTTVFCAGVIPSAFSPFDTKQMGKEDIEWLQNTLQQSDAFRGVLFDIGTGILNDFEVFLLFDALIVPYLEEEEAEAKKKKFEKLMEGYGLHDLMEKTWFINMGNEEEIIGKRKEIFQSML